MIIYFVFFCSSFGVLTVPEVQREADQQPEGGFWSGRDGQQRDFGSGDGGAATREGASEGGDPEAAGTSERAAGRSPGERLRFPEGLKRFSCDGTVRLSSQDLEAQALAEAESWREQQMHLQEQEAAQSRAKQELEAELERCKQVGEDLCGAAV